MTFIKCVEYNKEISDTVNKCPHCSYQMKQNLDFKTFIKGKDIENLRDMFAKMIKLRILIMKEQLVLKITKPYI